jgi:hypothetical protein
MFVAAKKPAGAVKGQLGKQFSSMRRKPGSARASLAKRPQAGAAGSTGAGVAGASANASSNNRNKFGANRSKMKMVDLAEVQGLQVEAAAKQKTETPKEARKRKLMEAAAAKGLVKKKKLNGGLAKPTGAAGTPAATAVAATTEAPGKGGGIVAAALAAYQSKKVDPVAPAAAGPTGAPAGQAPNGEWTQHLEKSNRLSPSDRERVRQFFVDRLNPTPGVPIVRLKLHEEKTEEQGTGKTVKETLYLELDYNTFGFKKLRKIKKK